MIRALVAIFLVASAVLLPSAALGRGHGPSFALATPTLGKGAWSLDLAAMGRTVDGTTVAMVRPMLGYGVTEDLQVSASLPVPIPRREEVAPERMSTMMAGTPDTELEVAWRFHRRGTDVGTRFESTAVLGLLYPTDARRSGIETSPGVTGAVVTGYASRSVYAWAGGLVQRYLSPGGATEDRPGHLAMWSLAVGYRPRMFRKELPHADWRGFLEVVGEHRSRSVRDGVEDPDTGGTRIFVGPTLLGLYGPWGISGGPMFPVHQDLNGQQRKDGIRFMVGFTYWF